MAFAAFFSGFVDQAEFESCASEHLIARGACAQQGIGKSFDVKWKLGVHFGFNPGAMEQRTEPGARL